MIFATDRPLGQTTETLPITQGRDKVAFFSEDLLTGLCRCKTTIDTIIRIACQSIDDLEDLTRVFLIRDQRPHRAPSLQRLNPLTLGRHPHLRDPTFDIASAFNSRHDWNTLAMMPEHGSCLVATWHLLT